MDIPSEEIAQNKNKNSSNNISDIVVNEMIEKIISLAISLSTKKEINSKIPQKCFNFIENIINSYISWNLITYDKDEIRSKNKNIISSNTESEIFPNNNLSNISSNNNISEPNVNTSISNSYFDDNNKILSNSSYGKNDWDFFDEPPSNKVDKYATTLIKYLPVKFDNKYEYDKAKVVKEEEEEEEINKTKVSKFRNSLKYLTNSKILRNVSRYNSVLTNNIEKVPVKTKPKALNEIMNEFSFHSIQDENLTKQLQNLDKLIHVDELRKEIEVKKEDDQKDIHIANKKRLEIINRIKQEEEKNKKYLGKNITKDHNGEIVFIKGIKLDKLKKDFFLPKTYFKSIKEKEKTIPKNIEPQIKSDVEKNVSIDEEKEIETNKEKDKSDIIKNMKALMKSRSKEILNKNNLPLFKKSNSNLTSFKINDKKIIKPNKDNPNANIIKSFVPGGSSFNLMNMEVGVTLREDNQYKSGGRDFFSKFKKYSFLNYDNQLKESLELNSLKANKHEGLNEASNTNFKNFSVHRNNIRNLFLSHENSNTYLDNTSQKYKSTRSSNTMNNNSSIKNSHFVEKKTLTYAKSTSNMNVSIERNGKLKPLIMLSNGSTSLNDIFSQNDTNLNTKNIKLILKKKNIFRESRNIKSLKNVFSLKDINNFNKAIMTNNNKFELHNLQENHFSLSPTRKPEKPLINEIYKEIGFNKTITRNRNKIMSLKKPLVLSTLNFFKQ